MVPVWVGTIRIAQICLWEPEQELSSLVAAVFGELLQIGPLRLMRKQVCVDPLLHSVE